MSADRPQIIVMAYRDGDVICRCPVCYHSGPLMKEFSLRVASAVDQAGNTDNVDLQQCRVCDSQLAWDNVEAAEAACAT